MPIKIKVDLDWGQSIYIKSDPEQFEHTLVGIAVYPPNQIKFIISYFGEITELYDFECSIEKDTLKGLTDGYDKDND